MKQIIEVYRATLLGMPAMKGARPVKMDTNTHGVKSTISMVNHLLWMLDEIERMRAEAYAASGTGNWSLSQKVDAHGKINRWLGFIQGWLWHQGVFTIDEMRDQVRKAA